MPDSSPRLRVLLAHTHTHTLSLSHTQRTRLNTSSLWKYTTAFRNHVVLDLSTTVRPRGKSRSKIALACTNLTATSKWSLLFSSLATCVCRVACSTEKRRGCLFSPLQLPLPPSTQRSLADSHLPPKHNTCMLKSALLFSTCFPAKLLLFFFGSRPCLPDTPMLVCI